MAEPTTQIATIDDKVPDRTTPEHNPAGYRAETMKGLSISSRTDASSVFHTAAAAASSSSNRSQRDKVRDLERKAREILARESEGAKEARRKRKQEQTNKFSSSSSLIEDGECCGECASTVGCCCCILS